MSDFFILSTVSRPPVIFARKVCFLDKNSSRGVTLCWTEIRLLALITSVSAPRGVFVIPNARLLDRANSRAQMLSNRIGGRGKLRSHVSEVVWQFCASFGVCGLDKMCRGGSASALACTCRVVGCAVSVRICASLAMRLIIWWDQASLR